MSRISQLVASTDDTQSKLVPIAAWKITVEVRGMDLEDRSEYLTALFAAREAEDQDALNQLDAQIVVSCVFDPEDNSPAFSDADVPMLMKKSAAVVGTLSMIAQRLSGLDNQAEERLGKGFSTSAVTAVQEAASVPSEGGNSPSPENLESQPAS